MKRRDFLGAGFAGYSLTIFADRIPAAAFLPAVPQTDRIRQSFDRIVPDVPLSKRLDGEPHLTLVDLDTDILIAGGGLAGVCAALQAARNGAKVVLVQDRSRLGGNSSSEVKMHVVGANCHKGRPGWRESGLLEEIRLDDAVNNPQRTFELWDLLLYDKVISEPNITLLLETQLYAAQKDGDRITEVLARCDKSEHVYRVRAKLFVDSTGDSRLGLEAGAEFRTGREERAEFGETLAPVKADEETLGSSVLFTARDYGREIPFTPPKWARKVTAEHLAKRKIRSWEYGYWWIEWGGDKDTIRDNELIRFELLSITMGVWDYIKNSGDHPTSANWGLDWVGMMPGKRGSRRMVGDVIVTQQDLENGQWEDAVAYGGWPMDDHPPGGFDRSDLPPNTAIRTDEVFNLPLRSMYSKNVSNLFMAGRNISASHVAFTSTRVMATCAVIGQAVGAAAAICVREGVEPRAVYENKALLSELQQTLLRDDATIKNTVNRDPKDIARRAKVSASGYERDAKPELVLDGVTRDIISRGNVEVHRWTERLQGDQGAWIELSWDEPQAISEVQLTFDSGFQRELTLSAADSVQDNMIRGPQPETAKDYTVSYKTAPDAELIELERVTGNHQRLRRHRFEPVQARAIRIHVQAANRGAQARVFEVRCYA
ncbi:MAG: FAD-dependent oxidoreductase [Acidobacteria bacterium]|nr:FAD-dependent oxidoreductase [Acidobacteriota bacterium]